MITPNPDNPVYQRAGTAGVSSPPPRPPWRRCPTKLEMPTVYYSTLMTVGYGHSAKDAAQDGQVILAKKLDELTAK